jgi:preprotein translocase subunit SecF
VSFVVLTFVIKLNVAIEFKGGTILTYSYEGDIKTDEIESVVADTVE